MPIHFRGKIIKKLLALLALSALFLSACGGAAATPATESATRTPSPDKYAQTWTKTYSKTTCPDWLKTITPAQQFAAAADILTSGRNKIDKGTGMPSDALIRDFQNATTTYCTIPGMTLTDATYAVYLDGKRFRP